MKALSDTLPKVAVIGGGSFGTALVKMVSENTGVCRWWMHNEESAAHIREYHHNPRYLSSVAFDEGSVDIYTDINAAIEGCDIVIFAVPSAFVKEVLLNMNAGALVRVAARKRAERERGFSEISSSVACSPFRVSSVKLGSEG